MQIRYTNDLGNSHSVFLNGPIPVSLSCSTSSDVTISPFLTAGDAFGRLRISSPFTLFDSSHRYQDNGLWATNVATGGTATFDANEGCVDLATTADSGSLVYRESLRVFPYQPGKSLLFMSTFVANARKANLRQRIGYFGADDGIYFELNGTSAPAIVRRSSVTGSVVNTAISQSAWNGDKLDGKGASGKTLDPTKAQIFWADFEWLGVGTVRTGFVIDGEFIVCHSFHHANAITSTYILTACLPCRYEIENTAAAADASTLKQICSTVISEGGYALVTTRGSKHSSSTPIDTPTDLPVADTFEPVIGIRLKSTRLDSISILKGLSLLGLTGNSNYQWRLTKGGTVTGGAWVNVTADSNLEINITGTAVTGGASLVGGFFSSSNQSNTGVQLPSGSLFDYQFERNSFTSTPTQYILEVASDSAGSDVYATLDTEDVIY